MVAETEKIAFEPIEIPRVRRGFLDYLKIGLALLALGGVAWAWQSGYRPGMFLQASTVPVDFVEIDRGDVDIVIVEYGTVESANNTTVRCQVEALIGTVGGAQGGPPRGAERRAAALVKRRVQAARGEAKGAREAVGAAAARGRSRAKAR